MSITLEQFNCKHEFEEKNKKKICKKCGLIDLSITNQVLNIIDNEFKNNKFEETKK